MCLEVNILIDVPFQGHQPLALDFAYLLDPKLAPLFSTLDLFDTGHSVLCFDWVQLADHIHPGLAFRLHLVKLSIDAEGLSLKRLHCLLLDTALLPCRFQGLSELLDSLLFLRLGHLEFLALLRPLRLEVDDFLACSLGGTRRLQRNREFFGLSRDGGAELESGFLLVEVDQLLALQKHEDLRDILKD